MTRILFERLSAVLNEIRLLQTGVSVQHAQIFMLIAAREGISTAEIIKLTKIPQASVSRITGDLADKPARRQDDEGLQLITVEKDEDDKRQKLCRLTLKGEGLVARIEQLMGAPKT